MRSFTPKDCHTLMGLLVEQATGQENVQITNTADFVSAGEKVMGTGMENVMNSLSIIIGKLLVASRPYQAKMSLIDAINTAMRELFLQIVYGRSQTAFSEGGLPIGGGLEDLGKGLRGQVGTCYATKDKGPRYLELTEGYITKQALNENNEIVGYEFVNLGKMMEFMKQGIEPAQAVEKAKGHYGQWDNAAKYMDPRHE